MHASERCTVVVSRDSVSLHSSDRSFSRRPNVTLAVASTGAAANAMSVSGTLRVISRADMTTSVTAATTAVIETFRIVWQPYVSEFSR